MHHVLLQCRMEAHQQWQTLHLVIPEHAILGSHARGTVIANIRRLSDGLEHQQMLTRIHPLGPLPSTTRPSRSSARELTVNSNPIWEETTHSPGKVHIELTMFSVDVMRIALHRHTSDYLLIAVHDSISTMNHRTRYEITHLIHVYVYGILLYIPKSRVYGESTAAQHCLQCAARAG